MKDKLNKIIELNELKLEKHIQEYEGRNDKIEFFKEYKFEKEYEYLLNQKLATTDLLNDYRNAIVDIKRMLL